MEPRDPNTINQHDSRERRCPMLGHEVQFSYCRAPGSATPCRKILDCWWETFDVRVFLERQFGKEHVETIVAPPPPKAVTLLDLIKQAQDRKNAT